MKNVRVELVDVNGSFARFYKNAPKAVRAELTKAIQKSAEYLSDEMYDRAPSRSAAPPHVKDAIDVKQVGLSARVGILDGEAPSGTDATMGEVGVFNEYSPNRQPFLIPAATAATPRVAQLATKAVERLESVLGVS